MEKFYFTVNHHPREKVYCYTLWVLDLKTCMQVFISKNFNKIKLLYFFLPLKYNLFSNTSL